MPLEKKIHAHPHQNSGSATGGVRGLSDIVIRGEGVKLRTYKSYIKLGQV